MAEFFLSGADCDFCGVYRSSASLQVFVGISASGKNFEIRVDQGHEVQKLSAVSTVDAIFQSKQKMDQAGKLNASIFVPSTAVEKCNAIKKLLFMDSFDVNILQFPVPDIMTEWGESEAVLQDYEEIVKEYLTKVKNIGQIKIIKSNLIPQDLFCHGYTTRWGGISSHPGLSSLSVTNSARKPDSVLVAQENKRRLCLFLKTDPGNFRLAQVEHGNRIWVYEKESPEKYDGIVTNTPGVTLAAPGADCMMVLLADPVAKACGAVHAGFAGVLAETLTSAVTAMQNEYGSDPTNILSSVGPCLGVCCADYHKDPAGFRSIHKDVLSLKYDDVPHVDLRMAARLQLERIGLLPNNIDNGAMGSSPNVRLAACTKCDPSNDFFSHRRDGVIFGNCLGFISLK